MPHCPVILFGACDRHNLGDLLFPHVLAALLPEPPYAVAGLVDRDLRSWGGHPVRAVGAALPSGRFALVHVGGEILTCEAADAALMLAEHGHAPTLHSGGWPLPYVLPRARLGPGAHIVHCAVGGATLADAGGAIGAAVCHALREADWVSVRDRRTRAWLAEHGIAARLAPDAGVLVKTLFHERIARHAVRGEPASLRHRFAQGWLAVQFSLDFADDASIRALADACDRLALATGLPIVLFRAGAAPLHDDLGLYAQVRQQVRAARVHIFQSIDIWDICAVIAGSRGFVGSSLHGRIVALAHGLPRVSLAVDPARAGKLAAFVETWETPDMPGVVGPQEAAAAMLAALARPAAPSLTQAETLAALCRQAIDAWIRTLPQKT